MPSMPPKRALSWRNRRSIEGFSIVELMVAMTISLLILGALVTIFVNTTRTHDEMAKTNGLIENGRLAVQVLENDLVHVGYWAGYVPQFDNVKSTTAPADVPSAVPDPCASFNTWNVAYRINLVGIPVASYGTLPNGAGCAALAGTPQRAGTDVLVIRHAETCLPGTGNCDPAVAGRLYMQTPLCGTELVAGTAQVGPATANTIQFGSTFSNIDGAYVGMTLHTSGGTGAGQYNLVTAYDGASRTATLAPGFVTLPDSTTTFMFDHVLSNGTFPLTKRDCATVANQRRFVSNIYYVTDLAHPDRAGEVIPTLVRSQFDLNAGALAQQAPEPLIEGVEQFRVELGVDGTMTRCGPYAVNYTMAINAVDRTTCLPNAANPAQNTLPTNRGDGSPDSFVRCPGAGCTVAQLRDVVAVKLYMLVRNRDTTPGYTDTKSYCLGELAADGTCPAANVVNPVNDSYKRHVFSTTVRLMNIAGRRETP